MLYWVYGGLSCGECVYFFLTIDIPNENYNHFILNQIHDMYITSPLKFMDEIFEFLTNLFVYQMLYKLMNSHIQTVAQSSKANVWNKDNKQM